MPMFLHHENIVFEDRVVYLAGNAYTGCTFRRCTIVVNGPPGPMNGCEIASCAWHIDLVFSDQSEWIAFLKNFEEPIKRSLLKPVPVH